MIEVRQTSEGKYRLYIDDSPVEESETFSIHSYPYGVARRFELTIRDRDIEKKVLAHAFSELPSSITELDISANFDWFQYVIATTINKSQSDESNESYGVTFFVGGTGSWKGMYSFAEYLRELSNIIENANNPEILVPYKGTNLLTDSKTIGFLTSFTIECRTTSLHLPMADEVARFSGILRGFHQEAIRTLDSRVRSESVVLYFDFPEEVRVPCEQYLLYFVQFLKDLGVEATADIQHEAGQVLFAVTPADKDQALDKIHAALKTYLQLASSPISGSPDPEDEVAMQRLLANVDHLKSQLRLSYLMVRSQEATIQAQQVTIDSQRQALSSEVLMDSLKNVTPRPRDEEKEEVIDGILALGKYEEKGITVNWGEMYRRLKRLFSKEADEQ